MQFPTQPNCHFRLFPDNLFHRNLSSWRWTKFKEPPRGAKTLKGHHNRLYTHRDRSVAPSPSPLTCLTAIRKINSFRSVDEITQWTNAPTAAPAKGYAIIISFCQLRRVNLISEKADLEIIMKFRCDFKY